MPRESCPACGAELNVDTQFSLCRKCKTLVNTAHQPLDYNDSYFTTDYLLQYGRTYEEDFANIYASCLKRIAKIDHLWKRTYGEPKPSSVLDIGAAMGFFLRAAQDQGYKTVAGLEISKYASGIARRDGFDVKNEDFQNFRSTGQYNVVSAWYFLEHAIDTMQTINKMKSFLGTKGILAISVPSYYGPLYRYNRDRWIDTHPVDHRVDFSSKSIKKLLLDMGFSVVEVYAAGIHPERVLDESSLLYNAFAPVYRYVAEKIAFSDTLEVYAAI